MQSKAPSQEETKKEHPEIDIKKSQTHNGMWPSFYYVTQYKGVPLAGDVIFTKIHNTVDIIEAHLSYLNDKDAQNKTYPHKRQGSAPTSSSTKNVLVNKR